LPPSAVKRGYNHPPVSTIDERPCCYTHRRRLQGQPGARGLGGGVVVAGKRRGKEREISGGVADTTNNRMEMTAVICALRALKRKNCAVHIYTDSRYVAQGMKEWLPNWRRRAFRKNDGKPIKNEDLWRELDALAAQYDVQWFWLRGHDGHPGNEKADLLASCAAAAQKEKLA